MKALKFIMASALCMLTLFSCSDSKTESPPEQPQPQEVDYLVMFYGQGGSNLDSGIMGNIYQALDAGSSDKVKMTFQYKLSKSLQGKYPQFDGTRRFTLDDNKQFVGTYKSQSASYPVNDANAMQYLVDNLKTEKIGDAKYDMPSAEGLSSFIKWSKSLYPGAKRVILIINGHGSGWTFKHDGKAATRGILPDDNLENKIMSASDIISGVKASGVAIDLFYADACLMSMYENLYAYADAFKYMLAAMEVTQGVGGNYTKMLNLLKSADSTEAGLVGAMQKFCDYLVTDEWWGNTSFCTGYSDIGFYDLSKLDTLTPVLKKITDALMEKYTSDEKLVSPFTPELPFGDSYRNYINYAINNSEIAFDGMYIIASEIPEPVLPYILADKVPYYSINQIAFFFITDLVKWMWDANNNHAHDAYVNHEKEWEILRLTIMGRTATSFSLTDMLRNLDGMFAELGVGDNTFQLLHDELIASLKSMAYIRCTEPAKIPGLDQAYELCSPGILIVPFNDRYYVVDYNYFNLRDHNTPEEAMSIYQNTTFDKKVGWSRFQSLITVQPSVFSNPSRQGVLKGIIEELMQGSEGMQ